MLFEDIGGIVDSGSDVSSNFFVTILFNIGDEGLGFGIPVNPGIIRYYDLVGGFQSDPIQSFLDGGSPSTASNSARSARKGGWTNPV